ncbi:MAG TPA: hypothetical protein VFF18_02095 [Woeseiaceae bacterium]|nr:hypothetical protein [Woeseiaceae bacterium]
MTTAKRIVGFACLLALILPAATATAAPQPWMRTDNPLGLYVLLSVGEECAIRRTEADLAVQTAFTRLDVPRASGWAPGELFLTAEVDCTQTTNYPDIYLYVTRVGFAVNYQEQPAYMMQYVRARYESFGIDSLGNIDQILTQSVEAALSDYKAANAGPGTGEESG